MTQDPGEGARRPGGWWQTLPGMLTAVAGVMTALAGLILALSQIGLLDLHRGPAAAASPPLSAAAAPAAAAPAVAEPAPGAQSVSFPAGAKVTLGNNRGRGTYELLGAQFERRTDAVGALTLRIRLTNAGPADLGFWNDSFRLVVDGVPMAPKSWLNTSVEARSAKDASVVFDLPLAAKSLKLLITSGDEEGEIALALAGAGAR